MESVQLLHFKSLQNLTVHHFHSLKQAFRLLIVRIDLKCALKVVKRRQQIADDALGAVLFSSLEIKACASFVVFKVRLNT